ncbi:MAG: hypothetical protein AABY05_03520 [Nanoarchaeota archaeon]
MVDMDKGTERDRIDDRAVIVVSRERYDYCQFKVDRAEEFPDTNRVVYHVTPIDREIPTKRLVYEVQRRDGSGGALVPFLEGEVVGIHARKEDGFPEEIVFDYHSEGVDFK